MAVPKGYRFGPRKSAIYDQVALFHAKVDRSAGPHGCWPWTGSVNTWGYGQATWGGPGSRVAAHRAAWEIANGEAIPEGHDVDHLCHNRERHECQPPCMHRRCCNPEHLEPATRALNTARGNALDRRRQIAARQTTCKYGHPLDGVKHDASRGLRRYCKTCHRQRAKARYQRRRES